MKASTQGWKTELPTFQSLSVREGAASLAALSTALPAEPPWREKDLSQLVVVVEQEVTAMESESGGKKQSRCLSPQLSPFPSDYKTCCSGNPSEVSSVRN